MISVDICHLSTAPGNATLNATTVVFHEIIVSTCDYGYSLLDGSVTQVAQCMEFGVFNITFEDCHGKSVLWASKDIATCQMKREKSSWGLMAPYGVIWLDQRWFRHCFVAWHHQAITSNNFDCFPICKHISEKFYSKYRCRNLRKCNWNPH